MTDPHEVQRLADQEIDHAEKLVEAAREALKILMKRRRDALKAKGLCTDCEQPSDGHTNCLRCRHKRNKRRLRKTA